MSSIKTQTTKKINWSPFLRPKVGDVVNHNDSDWVSVNGKNSEPSESNSDWGKVGGDAGGINQVLEIDNEVDVGKELFLKTLFDQHKLNFKSESPTSYVIRYITPAVLGGEIQFMSAGVRFAFNKTLFIGSNEIKASNNDVKNIFLPSEGGTLTIDPTNTLPSVRVNENEWRHQHITETIFVDDDYTVQSKDYDIVVGVAVKMTLTLPTASGSLGRELRIIASEGAEITPSINIINLTVSNSVVYDNDTGNNNIQGINNKSKIVKIKAININGDSLWVLVQNEDIPN